MSRINISEVKSLDASTLQGLSLDKMSYKFAYVNESYSGKLNAKLDVIPYENTQVQIHIFGFAYGAKLPIDTIIDFQAFQGSIINLVARHNGYQIKEVKVFINNGAIYLYLDGFAAASNIYLKCIANVDSAKNMIISLSSGDIPESADLVVEADHISEVFCKEKNVYEIKDVIRQYLEENGYKPQ